jgi:phosphatidylglycerol:prolipoprotein diacylglycerol transferase
MATHGLLAGAAAGLTVFVYAYRKPLLELADALAIPGALLMGLGRIGNFIDGQIVGAVTNVWWGVQFPDAVGIRHPVVLYDGVKNLLLIPYLLWVRKTNPTPGAVAARFVFWYAFLRLFIDLFRDYPTHRLALGTGQTLNIVMTAVGIVLLMRSRLRRLGRLAPRPPLTPVTGAAADKPPSFAQRVALILILLGSLTIPSNWTQDVPARYGKRHAGLQHSWLYPQLDTSPRRAP